MCTSQIEMTLSCRNLINMDILSKSDPYCILLMRDSWQERFYEVGRTETIWDCLCPAWVRKFIVDYNFEAVQRLRFEVWDEDPNGRKDFLGAHETTMAEIVVGFRGRQYVQRLTGNANVNKNRGEIIIVAEELSSCKLVAQLQFSAEYLPRQWWPGLLRPDAFLVLSRCNEDGKSWSVVAKSNVARSTTNPVWAPISISVRTLCNGDFERTIRVEVYDRRSNGDHLLIGSALMTLSELTNEICANACRKYRLLKRSSKLKKRGKPKSKPDGKSNNNNNNNNNNNPSKQLKKAKKEVKKEVVEAAGGVETILTPTLYVLDVLLAREVTFLDYIRAGTQMHFAVAIDFTSSNGDPREPTSLHYLHPQEGGTGSGNGNCAKQNQYELALYAVGEIISQYNTSGLYPAFGFGAKFETGEKRGSGTSQVSHQFPLNGNPAHPYCRTIEEIVGHYRRTVQTVVLHGPTNFSPVIHHTAQIAAKYAGGGKHYFVLLIITDGVISDLYQTKRQIVEASTLPLSIIIVGVGDADFSDMDRLDSDEALLAVDGRRAKRDIVQFVPLSKFLGKGGSSSKSNHSSNSRGGVPAIRSKADLAKEVLAEIPDQMTGYMKTKGFVPKPEESRSKVKFDR